MTDTKIAQIDDRGATLAWSPLKSNPDVVAVGAKESSGVGFEDTGGELEIYDFNMSGSKGGDNPVLLGSVKTESHFSSLAWSTGGSLASKYSMGLIAGGMENGSVHVWDPKAIMEQRPAIVASFSQHSSGPVKAVQFNSLNPTQLASGGSDGKVLIVDLTNPNNVMVPCESRQQTAQITSIAWNTQVAHVVASSSADGTVAVWDLKSRKAWCELRGETAGQAVSDIAWNPTQGLHLLTASQDDRNPFIKLWDLRSSTSMPLATLQGHEGGILSVSWCPHDEHLLLSTGKDNRTFLWDLFTLKPIAEVPNDVPQQQPAQNDGNNSDALFSNNGGLASSHQRRYDVQWSPIKRGVASTCSLDRKVQAHSILGLSSKSGRPPKWMRPSSSVSCAFGGALVNCSSADKFIRIRTIVEEPNLVTVSKGFEHSMDTTNVVDYCKDLESKARDDGEQQLWGFMHVIFETNARQELLAHLGFNPSSIAEAASKYSAAEDVTAEMETMSLDQKMSMTTNAQEMVKKALLVGNFEAAVDCCFNVGHSADALILASCGGPELWAKTQARYFEEQSSKRPFLSMVNSIMQNNLGELVQSSETGKWRETLAVLSTYGKSDEFPQLCIALGDRLEEAGNSRDASLCYMCALSLDKAVSYWRGQLHDANKASGDMDILALHKFVMKVSIFLRAAGSSAVLNAQDSELFSTYAKKLAEQGLLVEAAKYCKGDDYESKLLRDRLYRSKASPACLAAMGGAPPEFPFQMENISQSRGQVFAADVRAAEEQRALQQKQYQEQQEQQQAQLRAQQEQHQQQASTAAAAAPSSAPAAYSLPAGWMAIQDPASGNTYYANQTTGEVTWDRPQSVPAATPAPAPVPQPAPAPAPTVTFQQQPQVNRQDSSSSAGTNKLASKYGDGFVTSASHPELASQYGNIGTSNPYSGTARPGTAQVGKTTTEKAPVSGTLDPDKLDLPTQYLPIKDVLLGVIEALKQVVLSAADKRQLADGEKGVAVLLKRVSRGDVAAEIAQQVVTLTEKVTTYDWRAALSIQTGLVNTDWKEHKDWLKGLKSLLQLAQKKF